ncbi:PTS sugar transporter subunit IIC (plasmid) [Niallia taxi]|uniref:PTS sugar transporter subunit IIC n=1 Tax=Niallia taxi TaxID=2499688 RepID=UPI00124665EC|nr:PTS transporter subunit EIIC [Niallia taxi]MCM3213061.1 PTS transporter subunit EIIC [Niallia taxi]MED4036400.1 PTS transporter subunit EIIC [Niallia taxi]MED4054531.1 PTS transporter subunit EIIC [Niallia taxi]MED4122050.1 PTS transporter subunit EIIC [Niallia taxi]
MSKGQTDNAEKLSFIDKFTMFAAKLGGQIHLRSLRDAFAVIMPLFILAGVAVLVNNVIFPWFFDGDTLVNAQYWGTTITNGTLNIAGLLLAPMIAYCLSRNRSFKDPLAAAAIALATLVIMMPNTVSMVPVGAETAVDITGVLTFGNLGTTGMFAGIIIGLLATEIFIKVSSIKKLEISLGDNIPPAVSKSFNVMIPAILVLSFFGVISLILAVAFDTNLISLISTMIQEPLRKINTSLIGTVVIYSIGNFLFSIGIHQTVVNGALLDPLLLANMNENMLAYANGQAIPHIINSSFVPTFGMIGGTGSTISLILAIFLFGKSKPGKDIAKLATGPGLFNINEPVIFGYPIVFNIPMMIPFVLLPAIGIIVGYFATAIGFISKTVVYIPWTTPPLLSAYLATAGDWKAVILQALIIVGGAFLYLPFMKISERVSQMNNDKAA